MTLSDLGRQNRSCLEYMKYVYVQLSALGYKPGYIYIYMSILNNE